MILLKLFLVVILSPFWIPILLMSIVILILFVVLVLVFVLVFLFLILCSVIGILKILYNTHVGLVRTRQMVIKDIGDNIPLIRLGRLVFKRYRNQIREERQFLKEKAQERE